MNEIVEEDIKSWEFDPPLFKHRIYDLQERFNLNTGKLDPKRELMYLQEARIDLRILIAFIRVAWQDTFPLLAGYLIDKRIKELENNINAQENDNL